MGIIRMPVMREFLFGYKIKTGSQIIAIMSIISGFLLIMPLIVCAISRVNIEQTVVPPNETGVTRIGGISPPSETYLSAIIGIIATISVIQITISSMLLYGINKENTCLFWPWMVATFIVIIILGLLFGLAVLMSAVLVFTSFPFTFIEQLYILYKCLQQIIASGSSLVSSYYAFGIIFNHYKNLKSNYKEVDKMTLTP